MRSLIISAITKQLGRSSNPRNFSALICGKCMPHSCHGGYLDIPLYRPLHNLGFQDIYSNGIFSRGNNLYEESRVCKIGFSRVLSTQAIATEKEAEEEDKITSKGFRDSLYKRISRLRDPKRTVVELESWIREGGEANRWRLRNIVKALRKYHQYMHALKIFQWMRKKNIILFR